jgi:hypothetical protein
MRLRHTLPLAFSLLLAASTASAGGFAVITDQGGPNAATYLSPVTEAVPATNPITYTSALGVAINDTNGASLRILGLADQSLPTDEGKKLVGVGDPSVGAVGTVKVWKIVYTPANGTTSPATAIATEAGELTIPTAAGEPAQVDGAAIDALGNLYVQGRTFEMGGANFIETFWLWKYAPEGAGWKPAPDDEKKKWSSVAPSGNSANGGDVAMLADGTVVWSQTMMANPFDPLPPRYFTICDDGGAVATTSTLTGANLQAEGLLAGAQTLLAVGDGVPDSPTGFGAPFAGQVIWAPGGTMPDTTSTPAFLTGLDTGSGYFYGDLAGPAPTADTDDDGLSDAAEAACAGKRSIPSNTVPDFQNPDIDDDCVRDGAEPAGGVASATIPSANVDANCTPDPNGGAHRVCAKVGTAANAACVKGCRVNLPAAETGCAANEDCVADADPTVTFGQCQVQAPPAGGAGGEAGAGGEPAAGAGGEPAAGAGGEAGSGGQPAAGSAGSSGIGVSEGGGGAAGSSNGSGTGAGTSTGDEDNGCGCSVPGQSSTDSKTLLSIVGFAAALGTAWRRRRGARVTR